jgi:class 3 adenylate cyclase
MEIETHYALSRGAHIAYQTVGEREIDLVFVPPFMSNIDLSWDQPTISRFIMALAAFTRLIQFDRRGGGMSDGPAGAAPLEEQIDDVRAVIDAAGARHPALIAVNEGAALSLLFAASHPELVRALVLMTPQARLVEGPGYEWALSVEQRAALIDTVVEHWGRPTPANPWLVFGGKDPEQRRQMARYQRLAMGPGDARAVMEQAGRTDVRDVLASIQCPTLVLRCSGDTFLDVRHSRYVADHVPGARYVELSGSGQVWIGDPDEAAREIAGFLTGVRPPRACERLLATVLFTDIVESTERAARLGDSRWRDLLGRHDALVRGEVERHRGRVVKSLGDGALALFDGPSRAIGGAVAIRDGARDLGLQVRAGLHTGECELLDDDDVGGMAIHIGARIAALAAPEEVLTSSTVRDLSVGSSFALADRGEHRLKGVAEPWRLYAVDAAAAA